MVVLRKQISQHTRGDLGYAYEGGPGIWIRGGTWDMDMRGDLGYGYEGGPGIWIVKGKCQFIPMLYNGVCTIAFSALHFLCFRRRMIV